MNIFIFIFVFANMVTGAPYPVISTDGRELSFQGEGEVTDEIAHQFAYNAILVVTVLDADSLGPDCFYGFTSMKEIALPQKMSSIGERCFYECQSLKSIIIPEGITGIYSETFFNCISLESISISSTLTQIGYYAFYSSGLRSVTINSKLLSISSWAFYKCKQLEIINIKGPIEIIDSSAFRGCIKLTNIQLTGVNDIREYAFMDCLSLKSITFSNCSLKYLPNQFLENTPIDSITIPPSVEEIRPRAFYNCRNLQSVEYESVSRLTAIYSEAFGHCSLRSFNITRNLASINPLAFIGNSLLIEFTDHSSNQYFRTIDDILYSSTGNKLLIFPPGRTSADIWEETETIVSSSFYSCSNLEYVKVGTNVKIIENNAFYNCTSLKNIEFGNILEVIGNFAFHECKSLQSLSLDCANCDISKAAFQGCTSLSQAVLRVKSIGDEAFADCSNLRAVHILYTIQTIGRNAFDYEDIIRFSICADKFEVIGEVKCNYPIFVLENFVDDDIGGCGVLKIIDKDCNFPTGLFTITGDGASILPHTFAVFVLARGKLKKKLTRRRRPPPQGTPTQQK